MTPRIMFYVQHLMGVGHVFRAVRIARALAAAGCDVHLVQGGPPVPNADAASATTHFLPPLTAGVGNLSRLFKPDGEEAGEAYLDRRRDALLELFRKIEPDVLITEAFPFGRRQMRFELLPLLDAARQSRHAPRVVASVRDILQENRKPGRDLESAEYVERYYDHVLVHADPALIRLGDTFSRADRIAGKLLYTGIVAPEGTGTQAADDERFDVIVSVGGGVLGRELLFAAPRARQLSRLRDARWCIVAGINTSEADVADLRSLVTDGITIVRFLPDLRSAMSHCRLSVSRAGYNTVADIFSAGCRAVLVPLADGTETEQIRRADVLSRAGLVETPPRGDPSPEALAAAIDRAMQGPAPDSSRIDIAGARRSAEIVHAILSGRPLDGYR